jgi:hypothetical protein
VPGSFLLSAFSECNSLLNAVSMSSSSDSSFAVLGTAEVAAAVACKV